MLILRRYPMLVEKVNTPAYQLTLTADEMSRLWRLLHFIRVKTVSREDYSPEGRDAKDADFFFSKLEDARSPCGF
jgi:hypothetical protein